MVDQHKEHRKSNHKHKHGVKHGDDKDNLQGQTGKTHAIC